MKTLFTSAMMVLLFNIAFAQTDAKHDVFTFVEQMPVFPGGQQELSKFLSQNLRYPSAARQEGVEGKIFYSVCGS
jgi:hypothetical protein